MLDEVTMMSYTKGTIGGPAHTATDDLQNIMNLWIAFDKTLADK